MVIKVHVGSNSSLHYSQNHLFVWADLLQRQLEQLVIYLEYLQLSLSKNIGDLYEW